MNKSKPFLALGMLFALVASLQFLAIALSNASSLLVISGALFLLAALISMYNYFRIRKKEKENQI